MKIKLGTFPAHNYEKSFSNKKIFLRNNYGKFSDFLSRNQSCSNDFFFLVFKFGSKTAFSSTNVAIFFISEFLENTFFVLTQFRGNIPALKKCKKSNYIFLKIMLLTIGYVRP